MDEDQKGPRCVQCGLYVSNGDVVTVLKNVMCKRCDEPHELGIIHVPDCIQDYNDDAPLNVSARRRTCHLN